MPYSIRVDSQRACIEVRHEGWLTREQLEAARQHAADLLAKTKFSCLLVDGREANIGPLTMADNYEFSATHGTVLGGLRSVRIAVVVAPEHVADSVFSETVARNRGTDLRVFVEPEAARMWLRGSRPGAVAGERTSTNP